MLKPQTVNEDGRLKCPLVGGCSIGHILLYCQTKNSKYNNTKKNCFPKGFFLIVSDFKFAISVKNWMKGRDRHLGKVACRWEVRTAAQRNMHQVPSLQSIFSVHLFLSPPAEKQGV